MIVFTIKSSLASKNQQKVTRTAQLMINLYLMEMPMFSNLHFNLIFSNHFYWFRLKCLWFWKEKIGFILFQNFISHDQLCVFIQNKIWIFPRPVPVFFLLQFMVRIELNSNISLESESNEKNLMMMMRTSNQTKNDFNSIVFISFNLLVQSKIETKIPNMLLGFESLPCNTQTFVYEWHFHRIFVLIKRNSGWSLTLWIILATSKAIYINIAMLQKNQN